MACPESTLESLQWKVVPGFEAYEVSEYGDLRRRITYIGPCGRIYKAGTVSKCHKEKRTGYWTYSLGRTKKERAHVLVALAFIGPKPFPNAQVAHWDGNPDNNHYSNLRWATRKENAEDSIRHRTSTFGERNPRAKYTLELVRLIRKRYATENIEQKQLAREYGISPSMANQILNKRCWNFPEAFP